MSDWHLKHIPEPALAFGFGQTAEHPKDGLFLFGPPASNQNPARMDVGVIGTAEGIERYERWVRSIGATIDAPEKGRQENKMMWPGFEAVFGIPWPGKPYTSCLINGDELSRRIRIENRHEAIFNAVQLYEETLRKYLDEEEARPKLWFAVVPEEVFRYGRPKSVVPKELREPSSALLGKKGAMSVREKGSLFAEEMDAITIYEYELNFHNQLKARLLDTRQVIQVARETTLTPEDDGPRRSLQDPASVAWNLSTTSFYKADGKPWRIAEVREGVCYVGLVFKLLENVKGRDNACCGAQMFLGSGDGVVFKGAVGPWYSETEKSFHLSKEKAAELMALVVDAYVGKHGKPPNYSYTARYDLTEMKGLASPARFLLALNSSASKSVGKMRLSSSDMARSRSYAEPRSSLLTDRPISGPLVLFLGSKHIRVARCPIRSPSTSCEVMQTLTWSSLTSWRSRS